MAISNSLAKIDSWLQENRPEYWPELQPGLADADLDAFSATIGLTLPDAFRALYRWRNGQNPRAFDSFSGNQMFMELADITDAKSLLDGMIGTDFKDPEFWRREWIPFLADGAGNYTVVDLTAEGGGRLLDFWHDDKRRSVANASVEEWLDEVAQSMEDGSYESL